MVRASTALVLIAVACSRPHAAGSGAPSASGVRADEHGPPEPVSLPGLEKVCAAAPCSGEMARVTVWRTKEGKVAVFEHAGDLRRCSHPPTVFYDSTGQELDAIPLVPVVPGSDEAKKYLAIRDKHTHDLVAGETMFCKQAK